MTMIDTPTLGLESDVQGALRLLTQYTSDRQHGIQTGYAYGPADRFPSIRLSIWRSMITKHLGLTEAKARALMKQAEDAGEVVANGNGSAKKFRLRSVENARTEHYVALDARCRDLVARLAKFEIKAVLTGPSPCTYDLDWKGRATGVRIDGLDVIEENILYLLEAGSAASAD